MKPSSVAVVVPTASGEAARRVEPLVDHLICLQTPAGFYAVGQFYRDFGQTSDDEVRRLLEKARRTLSN